MKNLNNLKLDSYQYSFSPLLLFTTDGYFEDGFSNYNAVVSFFQGQMNLDMEGGVLYDRKNMHYDVLYELCVNDKLIVVCCIEQHFTAFKVLNKERILYYDPLKPKLTVVEGEGDCQQFIFYNLLKCNYADSQHILENEDHYNGNKSNTIRRILYKIWKNINDLSLNSLQFRSSQIQLPLDSYYFINAEGQYCDMSTQGTDNTCYFQAYLFVLLLKICTPIISSKVLKLNNLDQLRNTTINLCSFLFEFFIDSKGTIRPYSNNNVLLDFMRYKESIYYKRITKYLKINNRDFDYNGQYIQLLQNFENKRVIQEFSRFDIEDKMPSIKNTKELTNVCDIEGATSKLCTYNYYKYRAVNMMFGFHANIIRKCNGFYEFNSLRKNFLLSVYKQIKALLPSEIPINKYKEYYFHPQFEIGQQELLDVHQYTYILDIISLNKGLSNDLKRIINKINELLVDFILFSTQSYNDYEKQLTTDKFQKNKEYYQYYLDKFMSLEFFKIFVPLGFNQFNEKEKDKNALTHTVLYSIKLMQQQMYRQSFEFERECINQMAKSSLTKYIRILEETQDEAQNYIVEIRIGSGITYNRHNTLLHFLSVIAQYWGNPDFNGVQVFGKDVTALLAFVSQKIILSDHEYYHYGPLVDDSRSYSEKTDLMMGCEEESIVPLVSAKTSNNKRTLIVSDCVFGYEYLKASVDAVFSTRKSRLKSDDSIVNLCLLNLLIDFSLYDKYKALLNLPILSSQNEEYPDKCQLQVRVSNIISDHDKLSKERIQTSDIQELIWQNSHRFLIRKKFNQQSRQYKLINLMNSDPPLYQKQVLLCKIYMSLCQINKSVELEYYKMKYDGDYKIIIPYNFSKQTGEYLAQISSEYNFYKDESFLCHDKMKIFDMRSSQPEMNVYKSRLCSEKGIDTMYRYVEISNCFLTTDGQVIIFVGGNLLRLKVNEQMKQNSSESDKQLSFITLLLNRVKVIFTTSYVNKAISIIPCFKFQDSLDLIILTSNNFRYHVDTAGQFNDNYYGMKHDLIDNIIIQQGFIDANDSHQFQEYKLSQLVVEFKTLLFYPKYQIQIYSKQQLISLINYAINLRNVSLFTLLMFFVMRSVLKISFTVRDRKTKLITGPWYNSLKYVVENVKNEQYDKILGEQFFNVSQYRDTPIVEFIDNLCLQFQQQQKLNQDGQPQIIPTQKQKDFLFKLISGESFHFSEVGSGKSKVIVPLFCQMFLSNNIQTHQYLAKSDSKIFKTCLFLIVPEHLVMDAKNQIFRYCLNLNFREEYKIMDDVFNLLHAQLMISENTKMIFICSFTDFKKVLTYEIVSNKIRNNQDRILVLIDEVDDFLDREKLIFNICSNKGNDFHSSVIQNYYEISQSVYDKVELSSTVVGEYWKALYKKCQQIHEDVLHKSKSINKSFGIFNEQTLKHCSSNIAQDIEGYKSLIARPYESVNRAMPGSYYSDVERTIYLTYYILREDVSKFDNLFQSERKFITFDYYSQFIRHIDFDELIYGNTGLHHVLESHPDAKVGIIKYLYSIILSKMEIQDSSRSVNSLDIVMNFDCKGFTGTPFIDNYPTYQYVKLKRNDRIPDLIYRDFYIHSNTVINSVNWSSKFKQFQGDNNNVQVKYYDSQFLQSLDDEEAMLLTIFSQQRSLPFNCIVDLCGIFKRISVHGIKQAILRCPHQLPFKYIYHIDQTNLTDRILYVHNENDVQYDEDFIQRHTHHHGPEFAGLIFFFIDNRNFKGKDIPFQIPFKKQYGVPLINTSLVVAHDVDDFSSIWQAMGRSRTMNDTKFIIYKHQLTLMDMEGYVSMLDCPISQDLYIKNCDTKVIGNLSSIYQTLISIYNLSERKFYYDNELVNIFLLKMDSTIMKKLSQHFKKISQAILSNTFFINILRQILYDKLKISNHLSQFTQILDDNQKGSQLKDFLFNVINELILHKFEQRMQSNTPMDDLVRFLAGDQKDLHEYSYTKQQQKQKLTQNNKNQDNETVQNFKKEQQVCLNFESDDYFNITLPNKNQSKQQQDLVKRSLNHTIFCKEICLIKYMLNGKEKQIRIFPTIQFLYSDFIVGDYITNEVRESMKTQQNLNSYFKQVLVQNDEQMDQKNGEQSPPKFQFLLSDFTVGEYITTQVREQLKNSQDQNKDLQQVLVQNDKYKKMESESEQITVVQNFIKSNAQFTICYMDNDVYVIGMKNQFSMFNIHNYELCNKVRFISDELGFILSNPVGHPQNEQDIQKSVYCLSLYIVLEKITKQELAQNVINYYHRNYKILMNSILSYKPDQGCGFICWRFIMNQQVKQQL